MPYSVIAATDARWNECLKAFARSDVYFTAEYHKSFETSTKREALAFSFTEGTNTFFFPFLIGEVPLKANRQYYDIETVYGYSGPLANTEDPAFLAKAWGAYREWTLAKGVICQLVRFNPLLENNKFYFESDLAIDRRTVWVELQTDFRMKYHKRLRNYIVQAENMGLEFTELPDINQFREFYQADMNRLNAASYYYFEKEHFDFLGNSGMAKTYAISEDGKIISAISFLISEKCVHAHLFGTDTEHELRHYAIKFLYHKVIELYAAKGFEYLHMGGGRSGAEDDSLFDFKRKYGGLPLPYYLARSIIDPAGYDEVAKAWEVSGKVKPQNYLQFYRIN